MQILSSHIQANKYSYNWMMGPNLTGECWRGSVFLTTAVSPAFDQEKPDWSSSEYSTWTESVWTSPRLRIFLKPSPAMEWFAFLTGCGITVTSFVIVYFVSKHSKKLFKSEPSSRTSIDRTNLSEVST
jgi:nicastrin